MSYGGFVMDRLEARQIHPASIPGLVPMLLGIALVVCAVLLFLSAGRRTRCAATNTDHASQVRLVFTAAWSTCYALLLLGRMHFVLATSLYIAVFVLCCYRPAYILGGRAIERLKLTLFACAFALAAAVGIATLFQYAFLVRLP